MSNIPIPASSSKETPLFALIQKHADDAQNTLSQHHPEALAFLHDAGITVGRLRNYTAKLIASSTLATSLFLTSPFIHQGSHATQQLVGLTQQAREEQFSKDVLEVLPKTIEPLQPDQEKKIESLIQSYWGIHSSAELEGERLNHSYGFIGAEQHLPRYPGDTVEQHEQFLRSGITPGKGAWGYFAHTKGELTYEQIQQEKYYVAVQTLYLPDWNTDTKRLKEWYKYRKVLVVNPKNGKIIVCDIADAGPAKFTGKHFGGSPEVMAYLDLNKGMQKGEVILFFVDDQNNTVPLGPINFNVLTGIPEEKG